MMKLAAVASLLALPLVASTARADDAEPNTTTTTTTANTLVVVTPNAPIVVNSGGQAQAQPQAAVVLAPPGGPVGPSAAPGAAPQNEDWSNVSHINGMAVPVGERGAYLYKFKKTNISANPFGLFFGYYDVAASYGLSNNVALSVSASGWSHDETSGYQVTASLPIYFRRTYSGPFLEPGLIIRSSSNNDNYAYDCGDCGNYSNTETWAGPELLLGWHWTFDSGLNISAAAGVAKHMVSNANQASNDGYGSSDDTTDFNGYFRVGYNF